MGFTIDFSVLNQKGTPALYSDIFANRPAAGYQGRLFIATDTAAIYEDTGTAWTLIANVSSGAGTLQQVTTNGNTSNVGISVTAGGVSTNSLTDTSLTTGSVPFAGAGGLISQDNANLFWDDTNNRLGINTNTPGNSLDVHTSGSNPTIAINNTAALQSAISFLNTSVAKWRIGNTAINSFDIYNFTLAAYAMTINNASNAVVMSGTLNADEFNLQPNGYSLLASLSRNLTGAGYGVLSLRNSANGTIQPSTLSVDRTYTLPDATGTIALTSNLSAYLPLAGGTLTGALGGTSATLSSFLTLTTSDSRIKGGNTVGRVILSNSDTGSFVEISGSSNTTPNAIDLKTNNFIAFSTGASYFESARITNNQNFLIGSTVDDTVNKLQVTGSSAFQSAISVTSSGNSNYSGITTNPVQENNTVNLSTIFPNLSFSGRFISMQIQIVATNGGGGINSSIYNCSRTDANVWTTTLVSTTGTVVAYTFTYGGTGAAPTIAITDGVYIYKSVGYQIIMR